MFTNYRNTLYSWVYYCYSVQKEKRERRLLFFYQNKQAIKRESTTSQQYANNNRLYHTKIVHTERQLYIPAMLGAGISMTEFWKYA